MRSGMIWDWAMRENFVFTSFFERGNNVSLLLWCSTKTMALPLYFFEIVNRKVSIILMNIAFFLN